MSEKRQNTIYQKRRQNTNTIYQKGAKSCISAGKASLIIKMGQKTRMICLLVLAALAMTVMGCNYPADPCSVPGDCCSGLTCRSGFCVSCRSFGQTCTGGSWSDPTGTCCSTQARCIGTTCQACVANGGLVAIVEHKWRCCSGKATPSAGFWMCVA